MSRAIEFDYDKAIDQATKLFWKSGYTNTSLRDLLKVMEIGEGSFYNTLKSKKHLYLECLKHYKNTVSRKRETALFTAPNAKVGIRSLFQTIIDELDNPETPRVCLMARSVSSDVFAESDLQEFVQGSMSVFVEQLLTLLESAKKAGEFPPEFDPKTVASVIGTYIQGLFGTALVSHDRPQIERQIDVFLKGLGI